MVSAWAVAVAAALCACACSDASLLLPAYVTAPESVRNQRSLDKQTFGSHPPRTMRRLVGGHIKLEPSKSYGDPAKYLQGDSSKNLFAYDEKSSEKLDESKTVWNQGAWDDGMLMSSAGEGKDAKAKEEDEDKKTLSDQVAEGKYGLIQNELFQKLPKRPGVVSYETNPDTRDKDNLHTLGGLDKDDIWLAEDHLLVLKGGNFQEQTDDKESTSWPVIDDYEAPRRQVKLPQKPLVPPPFPVRLADDGPLVFLTPNGSVPAAFFPPFPQGAGDGSFPPAAFPYPQSPYAYGGDSRNFTAGGAPFPVPPFPFLPGNASEGAPYPFPFPPSINASFPDGFPPGAAFLPPPDNQTDLYDEDDPSIYYPPPYNFSYRVENDSAVPAGPLVPGIVLPPPPDFFAPLEEKMTEKTATEQPPAYKTTIKRPHTSVYTRKHKPRPTTTEGDNSAEINTSPKPITKDRPVHRQPPRVVQIPRPIPITPHYVKDEPANPISNRGKTTLKPVSIYYDYNGNALYNVNSPPTSSKPFEVYGLPQKTSNIDSNSIVTSTPVPLRAYYTTSQTDDFPKTELKPVYNTQKDKTLTSFYFFDEQPKSTPAPALYDDRDYYNTANQPNTRFNPSTESGFTPSVNVAYGSLDQDNLLLWPQKQGPRTLTQEYFSIQKPKKQQVYVQQNGRPESFLQQIADIQQTIDYLSTNRPKQRVNGYKPKPTVRPVYQYSYQSKPRQQEQITFRAPKLDTEPFRPMVSYSKPYNVQQFNSISSSPAPYQQYLVENVKVTTESPTSSKYYPKAKDHEYDDVSYDQKGYKPPKSQRVQVFKSQEVQYPATTPSALDHGYYTKQDERYVDDITKNYFEVFGKKLEEHDGTGIAVTPALQTVRTPINNAINLQYAEEGYRKPAAPSLADDTLVNYRKPRPYVNPDSEFVPIPNPAYQQLAQIHQYLHSPQPEPLPPYSAEQLDLYRPPNLANDIAVNFRRPPPINPDAEFIEPVNSAGEGRPGSFVSYRLPGQGAHVYFLTPQAARDRFSYRPR